MYSFMGRAMFIMYVQSVTLAKVIVDRLFNVALDI